jgi:hypothetical protein
VAQSDVFSVPFHPSGTALAKLDEKAADEMAFKIADLAPDCKQTNAQDLADKFQTMMGKYGD